MAASLLLDFTPGSLDDGVEYLIVEATRQLSRGRAVQPKDYRIIGVFQTPDSPIELIAFYTAVFGRLLTGTKLAIRLHIVKSTTPAPGVPSSRQVVEVVVDA